MLAKDRIILVGESPHAHEQEAIDFAIQALPGTDPYTAWGLVELLEPSTGRLYEIDLLVLGYSALYLVEIKSAPGKYEGDQVDWYVTKPEHPTRWMDPPLRLANLKAKVLKSRLRSKMHKPDRAPRVEALVFLSHPDIDMQLSTEGRVGVVTRSQLARAITHHKFPGVPEGWRMDRVDQPLQKDITQALAALGLKKRKGKLFAGQYELGGLIDDGILQLESGPDGPPAPSGYQDRHAKHREAASLTQRARVYLVPQQTSVERRQILRRAAEREVQLLHTVREHPSVLAMKDYIPDAPLGPTVLFDAFEGGIPLDAFLRQTPAPTFEERKAIVTDVARALAHCHKREVRHGALGPHAVLVRMHPDPGEKGRIETRLFNFQLGAGHLVRGTVHASALSSEPWALYQAPELRQESGQPTLLSDIFSLGALAYFVFTGRAPAEDPGKLDERLLRDGSLDPRVHNDDIPKPIVDAIQMATDRVAASRADDAGEWIELVLAELQPAALPDEKKEIDPLEARKDDCLDGELTVQKVLGYGATSRVLEVRRASDDRVYALKVSLAIEHDDRLREEARQLQLLEHSRIVQVVEPPRSIGERVCLLLTHAGDLTLQRELAKEGSVSLEFAGRYGEDLLSALVELEQKKVLHRDIKPANVGVGSVSKGSKQLTLFDLSLGLVPISELTVGTAVYRDPFLRLRGGWDAIADRWSAAVTLHEMLTGIRPTLVEGSTPDTASLTIAAERVDPTVRDGIAAFFARALDLEAERRFASAREMVTAWGRALQAPVVSVDPLPASEDAPVGIDYGAIGPDTPVALLPLSARARNALDRAGVLRAVDTLTLPDNRLSAIRGVGMTVAKEVLAFRDQWRAANEGAVRPVEPFYPGFVGDDVMLATVGLPSAAVVALGDAGIHTLGVLASSAASHVAAVADKNRLSVPALRALLERETRHAGTRDKPTTLELWIDALIPASRKRAGYVQMLYGLAAPFEGRLDVTAREVADECKMTPANLYIGLGKLREEWAKHGAISELVDAVHAITKEAAGALPLAIASEALRARMLHDKASPLAAARGAAAIRVVAEIEKERQDGVRIARISSGARPTAWLLADDALGETLQLLGRAADGLAARAILASPAETARVLAEVVKDTALASAPPERVAEIAALASKTAVRSTRYEIYPRGLPASRALALSAAVLSGGLSVGDVQRRVAARYPDAEALPDRPALDGLLDEHGLVWVERESRYLRRGEDQATTLDTSFNPPNRAPTVSSGHAKSSSPGALGARAIDDKIAYAMERRLLRVIGVPANLGREGALRVAERVGARVVSFDAELLQELRDVMRENEVDPEVVHTADREGPAGAAWPNLLQIVETAAERVARRLFPPKTPLVLTQLGLLARYGLDGYVRTVVEASKDREAAAIFLVVPAHDTGGTPRINGTFAIHGALASDTLWITLDWIENKHNEAA